MQFYYFFFFQWEPLNLCCIYMQINKFIIAVYFFLIYRTVFFFLEKKDNVSMWTMLNSQIHTG